MPPSRQTSARRPVPWTTAAKLLALFCLILGAKFWLLRIHSTPLPFFDQWEGEGQEIIQRDLHGTLGWRDFFAPFVQHRILWTRLLVWGLFRLNGQWDTQVEGIAAAMIHAVCAVALGAVLVRRLGRAAEDKILLGLAFLFSLPFGWENAVSGGFASQYYFLIGFSVVAMWGLGSHRPWSGAWWTGGIAAVLAWFSMGSGGCAGFAVAAWMAVLLWQRRGPAREHRVTLIAALLLGLGGTSLMVGSSPAVDNLRAHSVGEFSDKFLGLLSWPVLTPPAAIVAYAPFGWFVWNRWRGGPRSTTRRADGFVFSLGVFCLLQTAAIAYARNHYRDLWVSRYMDILSLGTLANLACLLLAAREARAAGARQARIVGLAGAAWIAVVALGLSGLTSHDLDEELPVIQPMQTREVANVAAFAAAPDPALLAGKNTFDYLCNDQKAILGLLMDPAVRGVLPPLVRTPLPILLASEAGNVRPFGSAAAPAGSSDGWLLNPPTEGDVSSFRSRMMRSDFASLDFPVAGRATPGTRIVLVGERSGRTFPLELNPVNGRWRTLRVPTPGEPFHLEATLPKDATQPLAFLSPREVGRLSAWVATIFGWNFLLLFGGAALWLGASFYQRQMRGEDGPAEVARRGGWRPPGAIGAHLPLGGQTFEAAVPRG